MRRLTVLVGVTLLLPLLATSPAQANVTSATTAVVTPTMTIQLVLQFDKPVSQAEADQLAVSSTSTFVVECNHTYPFRDGNGLFTIQRACNATSAPWGFQLSAARHAEVVGTVNEQGWIGRATVSSNQGRLPIQRFGRTINSMERGADWLLAVVPR